MKTRILSGIIMILLVIAVLFTGSYFPVVITAFIALLAAAGSHELLANACGVKDRVALGGACIYAAVVSFAISGYWTQPIYITVLYFLFAVIMTLRNHKEFKLVHIFAVTVMPIILSYAFGCLENIINRTSGIFYLLLLLNFSSICDMGAYFVGSSIGKIKLCPGISPHKTVEGAVGGIAASLIVTVILALSFGIKTNLWLLLAITVPFCIIGMLGDLFASAIKRAAGIKDYGTLIPGHGGVLDRVDSILLTAPVLFVCIQIGVI